MSRDDKLRDLLAVIEEVAAGNYTQDIIRLTADSKDPDLRRIAEAVAMMMVKIEAREYRLELVIEELRQTAAREQRATLATIQAMAEAINARDPRTEGHGRRVAELAEKIAASMDLDIRTRHLVGVAGLIHDIGKIGFSDAVFENTTAVPPPEILAEIRRHPRTGYNILHDLDFLGEALDFVLMHHERLDGSGYPNGLKSDDIPMGARILAVADTFDAITSNRAYQKGSSAQKAVEIIEGLAGKSLDPVVVRHLRMVTIDNVEQEGIA